MDVRALGDPRRLVRAAFGKNGLVIVEALHRLECDPVADVRKRGPEAFEQPRERTGGQDGTGTSLAEAHGDLIGTKPDVQRRDSDAECGHGRVAFNIFRTCLREDRDRVAAVISLGTHGIGEPPGSLADLAVAALPAFPGDSGAVGEDAECASEESVERDVRGHGGIELPVGCAGRRFIGNRPHRCASASLFRSCRWPSWAAPKHG